MTRAKNEEEDEDDGDKENGTGGDMRNGIWVVHVPQLDEMISSFTFQKKKKKMISSFCVNCINGNGKLNCRIFELFEIC